MRYRKLRIAWSVAWGILCLLLLVLCVRSYWYWDFGGKRNVLSQDWTIRFDSMAGVIQFRNSNTTDNRNRGLRKQGYGDKWFYFTLEGPSLTSTRGMPQFWWRVDSATQEVCVPWWCLTAICGMVAAIPWIRWKWRFSLRTLLIATTLVAMVLGLIVAVLRWPAG